jgi:hypothetical protein
MSEEVRMANQAERHRAAEVLTGMMVYAGACARRRCPVSYRAFHDLRELWQWICREYPV